MSGLGVVYNFATERESTANEEIQLFCIFLATRPPSGFSSSVFPADIFRHGRRGQAGLRLALCERGRRGEASGLRLGVVGPPGAGPQASAQEQAHCYDQVRPTRSCKVLVRPETDLGVCLQYWWYVSSCWCQTMRAGSRRASRCRCHRYRSVLGFGGRFGSWRSHWSLARLHLHRHGLLQRHGASQFFPVDLGCASHMECRFHSER